MNVFLESFFFLERIFQLDAVDCILLDLSIYWQISALWKWMLKLKKST